MYIERKRRWNAIFEQGQLKCSWSCELAVRFGELRLVLGHLDGGGRIRRGHRRAAEEVNAYTADLRAIFQVRTRSTSSATAIYALRNRVRHDAIPAGIPARPIDTSPIVL